MTPDNKENTAVSTQEPSTPQTPADASQTPAENSTQQQVTPDQVASFLGTTPDGLAKFTKFMQNSGGFDGAFAKVKSEISNPQSTAQTQTPQNSQPQSQRQSQSQPQSQPAEAPATKATPEGFFSIDELNVQRYFRDLAREPKYANIAKEIEDGTVLKEMGTLGIHPIDGDYNINVGQIEHFLELKSKSMPAVQSSVEPTNTPTVEYIYDGENVSTADQAYEILRQSNALKRQGKAPHPAEDKAKEFLKGSRTQA